MSVEVFPVESWQRSSGAGRPPTNTEYVKHLENSYNDGTALGAIVNSDEVSKVKSRIRTAAAKLGLGVRIKVVDHGDGTSTVKFQAQDKKGTKSE